MNSSKLEGYFFKYLILGRREVVGKRGIWHRKFHVSQKRYPTYIYKRIKAVLKYWCSVVPNFRSPLEGVNIVSVCGSARLKRQMLPYLFYSQRLLRMESWGEYSKGIATVILLIRSYIVYKPGSVLRGSSFAYSLRLDYCLTCDY